MNNEINHNPGNDFPAGIGSDMIDDTEGHGRVRREQGTDDTEAHLRKRRLVEAGENGESDNPSHREQDTDDPEGYVFRR